MKIFFSIKAEDHLLINLKNKKIYKKNLWKVPFSFSAIFRDGQLLKESMNGLTDDTIKQKKR